MATNWTPEPCTECDNGHPCETHAPVTWPNEWLTADDVRTRTNEGN